jgi:hypothetical protein
MKSFFSILFLLASLAYTSLGFSADADPLEKLELELPSDAELEREFDEELEADKALPEQKKVPTAIQKTPPAPENNPQNLDLNTDQILRGEALKDSRIRFKGEKNSAIDWTGKQGEELLDYKKWKAKTLGQEKDENYTVLSRAKENREVMARVISCIGTCMAQREAKDYRLQQKSRLLEGDEVFTEKDSYLWLALSSGEVLRLAPETSLFLREVNFIDSEIFYFLRVNQGFLKLAARQAQTASKQKETFTDPLALPLYPEQSNPKVLPQVKELDMTYAQAYFDLVKTNNIWREKIKSHFLVSLPNVVLKIEDSSFDIFTSALSKTYVKLSKEGAASKAKFFLLDEAKEEEVLFDTWLEISFDGKVLGPLKEFRQAIYDGEIFFKNIIPLRFSSEMLMRIYLAPAYEQKLNGKTIALEHGLFRWDLLLNKESYEKRKIDLFKWALFLEKGNRDKSILSLTEKGKTIERQTLKDDVHERALKLLEVSRP